MTPSVTNPMKRPTTPTRRTALAVHRLAFCGVMNPRLGDKSKICPSPGGEITTPYPGVVHSPYEGGPAVFQFKRGSPAHPCVAQPAVLQCSLYRRCPARD